MQVAAKKRPKRVVMPGDLTGGRKSAGYRSGRVLAYSLHDRFVVYPPSAGKKKAP